MLTLGDGGTTRNGEKLYLGLQVTRQIQSDWVSENDIGILARNLDSSLLDLRLVSGFTIGLRTLGDGRGFEDSTLLLGRILNNRYGLDAHAATATAWNTSIRYHGGHFACGTPRHMHPGDEIAQVIEGSVTLEMEGDQPRTFQAGQTFHPRPMTPHIARNASASAPARLIVSSITEAGKPSTIMLPPVTN